MTTAAVADPEADYFQTVEEFFVSRRGDPLFLSNADWLLIRKWRKAGIPLRIVLRGITDALDSHAHSWGRNRKVGSLAYCAAEVDAARERWQRAVAYETGEGIGASEFLRQLADALERAEPLGAGAASARHALVSALREGSEAPLDARTLEPWLREQEQAFLAAVDEDDGGEVRRQAAAEVDATLGRYRDRMPAAVLEKVREESIARRVLERLALPRFSLFLL
ncbi:MAG TPA: hypothetical protein VGL15_17455 [Vicinamibacteria bacterium]